MLTADDVNFINGMIDMALITERRRLADKIRDFYKSRMGCEALSLDKEFELLAKVIESK